MPTHPRRSTHNHRIVSISRKNEHDYDGQRQVVATVLHAGDLNPMAVALSALSSILYELQTRNDDGEWVRVGFAFRGQCSSTLPKTIVIMRTARRMETPDSLRNPDPRAATLSTSWGL